MEGRGEKSEAIDEASEQIVEFNPERSEGVDATDGETAAAALNEFTELCAKSKVILQEIASDT